MARQSIVMQSTSGGGTSVSMNGDECTIIKNGVAKTITLPKGSKYIDVTDKGVYINGKRINIDEEPQTSEKLTIWQHIKRYFS